MSVITYDLLLQDKRTDGSIANWVKNDAIPVLAVLRMAEQWIAMHLRVRQMRELTVVPLAAGQHQVVVPDRLIGIESLLIKTPHNYRLIAKTMDELQGQMLREPDGALSLVDPRFFSFHGQVVQFNSTCVQAMTAELLGLYALAPLSTANPTNLLTEQALMVLMFACAGFASEFLRDPDESSRQLSLAKGSIDRLNVTHGMALRNIDHAVSAVD